MLQNNRHLYFAYGSNLNRSRMRQLCPTAKPICAYRLADWRLEFRIFADIAPCPNASVDGALYDIGPHDIASLDEYEGYDARAPDKGLYRKDWLTVEVDGKQENALVYLMNRNGLEGPGESYFDSIVQGFHDWKLPIESLSEARMRAER